MTRNTDDDGEGRVAKPESSDSSKNKKNKTTGKVAKVSKPAGSGLPPTWQEKRNVLIEEYQGYVESIVAKLVRTMGLPAALRDDFISSGLLGLVEAADRFDPERGADFRAFAFFRIRGAIIDHVRSSCDLSGHAYKMFRAFEAAHEVQQERFTSPQPRGKNKKAPQLIHAIEFLTKSAVAYKLVGLKSVGDSLDVEQSCNDPEEELSKKRESEKLRRIVATLPEKERTIIEQYYFHDVKFVEVAERYAGLSKSWVCRLHDRALSILRQKYLENQSWEGVDPDKGSL